MIESYSESQAWFKESIWDSTLRGRHSAKAFVPRTTPALAFLELADRKHNLIMRNRLNNNRSWKD